MKKLQNWLVIFAFSTIIYTFSAIDVKAQQGEKIFKVGDTIYVNAYYGGCVKAKVLQTEPAYYVHIEEGMYKDKDTFYNSSRMKECKQTPPPQQDNQGAAQENRNNDGQQQQQPTPNGGNLQVGDRVDVYLSDNKETKDRGTIVEIDGSQYKVRYDGCGENKDAWENQMFVRPAATVSAADAEIKYLIGKWSMISVGIGSGGYWAWGKAPGIQINADGTYIWYQDGGKPPVKGKWTTHARFEGARYGFNTKHGIVIKDAKGGEWKMTRVKSLRDDTDRITITLLCQGLMQDGSRVQ